MESLAVQEAAPEEVAKDLTQLFTMEEKSAKIKLDLLNTYSVHEVTTDTTAEETKTFIEERVRADSTATRHINACFTVFQYMTGFSKDTVFILHSPKFVFRSICVIFIFN